MRDDRLLLAGLTAAYAAFAWAFRGPRGRFWQRMTATGVALGGLALATEPQLRARVRRPRQRDAAIGLGAAAGLYVVFRFGDRMARRIMPKGALEIDQAYALRALRPTPEIAARLAFVIAPAEELFWRGFVQRRLQRKLGRWKGAAVASWVYGGAHLATANLTLVGAATTAGAFWSALEAAGVSMPALIASHVAWDVWIFLLQPTRPL